jgi:hypothetical protein
MTETFARGWRGGIGPLFDFGFPVLGFVSGFGFPILDFELACRVRFS